MQVSNENQLKQRTHLEIISDDVRPLRNAANTPINTVFFVLAIVSVIIARPPDNIRKSFSVIYELGNIRLLVGNQFIQSLGKGFHVCKIKLFPEPSPFPLWHRCDQSVPPNFKFVRRLNHVDEAITAAVICLQRLCQQKKPRVNRIRVANPA